MIFLPDQGTGSGCGGAGAGAGAGYAETCTARSGLGFSLGSEKGLLGELRDLGAKNGSKRVSGYIVVSFLLAGCKGI